MNKQAYSTFRNPYYNQRLIRLKNLIIFIIALLFLIISLLNTKSQYFIPLLFTSFMFGVYFFFGFFQKRYRYVYRIAFTRDKVIVEYNIGGIISKLVSIESKNLNIEKTKIVYARTQISEGLKIYDKEQYIAPIRKEYLGGWKEKYTEILTFLEAKNLL